MSFSAKSAYSKEEILSACNNNDLEIAATCLPDQRKGEKIVLLSTINLDKNQLSKILSDAKINPLDSIAETLSKDIFLEISLILSIVNLRASGFFIKVVMSLNKIPFLG